MGLNHEYVVGFALARWELRPSTDPPPNTDHEFMQGIASGLSESMYNVRGFIQYPVLEVAKLSIQHAVQSDVDYSANVVELDLLLRVLSDFAINLPDGSVYSVRGLLNRWQRVHQPSAVVSVKLAPPFASKVVNSEWSLLHIVVFVPDCVVHNYWCGRNQGIGSCRIGLALYQLLFLQQPFGRDVQTQIRLARSFFTKHLSLLIGSTLPDI